jgi:anoctamin-10
MLLGKDIKLKEVLQQVDSNSYETFDDYLELVLEFGYLTLFAECFPLAPVFIIIVNSIEYRSDLLKLTTIYKRPHFHRKRNIGSWHFIIQFLSTLAVFTNLLLTVSPSKDSLLKGYISEGYKYHQFFIFFLLEHFVFILIIFIRLAYKSQCNWVSLFLQRKDQIFKKAVWKNIFTKNTIN